MTRPIRILLVEDNAGDVDLIKDTLEASPLRSTSSSFAMAQRRSITCSDAAAIPTNATRRRLISCFSI
jgi:hypothetical protein